MKKKVPPQCSAAIKLFFDDINSGKIKIDSYSLKIAQEKRCESLKNEVIKIIGYDHNDKTALKKATQIYREEGLDNVKSEKKEENRMLN